MFSKEPNYSTSDDNGAGCTPPIIMAAAVFIFIMLALTVINGGW